MICEEIKNIGALVFIFVGAAAVISVLPDKDVTPVQAGVGLSLAVKSAPAETMAIPAGENCIDLKRLREIARICPEKP